MRKTHYLIFILFTIIAASCNKDTVAYGDQYDRSYRAWQHFKDSSGNSYRYTIVTYSWTRYSTATTITVKKGKIVQRSFMARGYANDTTNTVTLLGQWDEDEAQLSTHQDGAAPHTLDDLYKEVKQNWLVKRDKSTTYFEATNNGMISAAGYVPTECQDDCFMGIRISLIEAI